jgi:hypothetical protein
MGNTQLLGDALGVIDVLAGAAGTLSLRRCGTESCSVIPITS